MGVGRRAQEKGDVRPLGFSGLDEEKAFQVSSGEPPTGGIMPRSRILQISHSHNDELFVSTVSGGPEDMRCTGSPRLMLQEEQKLPRPSPAVLKRTCICALYLYICV